MFRISLITCLLFALSYSMSSQSIYKKYKNGKIYFANEKGKAISKSQFDQANNFREGLAAVLIDGKWGYVDRSIDIVIAPIFAKAFDYNGGFAVVKEGDFFHLINKAGESTGAQYDSIGFATNYMVFEKEKLFGIMDRSGTILEEAQFERIGGYYQGGYAIKQNGRWGLLKDGTINFDDPELYFEHPDVKPMLDAVCAMELDAEAKRKCNQKKTLEALFGSIRYPAEARANSVRGTVMIQFIVNKEGEMINPIIVKDIGAGCGAECLRVVNEVFQNWQMPGMVDDLPVNTIYNLPVKFRLE